MRLSEIRQFIELNPACVDRLEEVQRAPASGFDELTRTFEARVNAIKSRQRLRPPVLLKRNDSLVVQTQSCKKREELRCHKWKVASDDDGPFLFARGESGVKPTKCAPLWIDIGNGRKT